MTASVAAVPVPQHAILSEEIRTGEDICRSCGFVAPGGWCFPCELLHHDDPHA